MCHLNQDIEWGWKAAPSLIKYAYNIVFCDGSGIPQLSIIELEPSLFGFLMGHVMSPA